MIIQLYQSPSQHGIAKALDIARTTVQYTIQKNRDIGTVENSYQGSRAKITERGKRHLIRLSEAEPFATAAELKQKADIGISPHQINVILRKYGLKCRRPRRAGVTVPFLKPGNVRHRLAWCEARKDWTAVDWRHHIFTDKSTYETGRRRWDVYVIGLVRHMYLHKHLGPTFKSGRTTSNHWGAISYWGRSELKCLRGRLNAKLYIEEVLLGPLRTFDNECRMHSAVAPASPPPLSRIIVEFTPLRRRARSKTGALPSLSLLRYP